MVEYIHNYYYVLLVVVLFIFLNSRVLDIDSPKNITSLNFFGGAFFIFLFIYMGLRPIPMQIEYDTAMYMKKYISYQMNEEIILKDPLFDLFMLGSSKILSYTGFFILCAFFYAYPLYKACLKWFGKYAFYGFLFFVVSFSFLAYGINTIRSGLAASVFLFAISRDRNLHKYILLFVSVGLHQSFLLPVLVYIALILRKEYKVSIFLLLWVGAILVSFFLGNILNNAILMADFIKERAMHYLSDDSSFSSDKYDISFRWDFLLYSSIPIFWGTYIYYKKKYKDIFFKNILTLYLVMNSFWILIMQIPYSDRFAYLSWFLLPLLFCYPILKSDLFANKNKIAGQTLLMLFLFTFFMAVVR